MLNFGHTIGHAVEHSIRDITHGEAVAIGIVAEMTVGDSLGITEKESISVVKGLFRKIGLDYKIPSQISMQDIVTYCKNDKKNRNINMIDMVLLKNIGEIAKYHNKYSWGIKPSDMVCVF